MANTNRSWESLWANASWECQGNWLPLVWLPSIEAPNHFQIYQISSSQSKNQYCNISNHPDWINYIGWRAAPTKSSCCTKHLPPQSPCPTFDPFRPGDPESSHHLQHGGSFAGARHAADVQHLAIEVWNTQWWNSQFMMQHRDEPRNH